VARITGLGMVSPAPRTGGEAQAEEPAATLAIRRLEERLGRDPSSPTFAPLADAYRKAGRTREAIALCREGLARFPDYATARLVLARALLEDGNPDGALTELRAILAANPADARAHRLAGELERRAGRIPQALEHLRRAVALDPSDRESSLLATVLGSGGRVPQGSALARILADDTFATVSFGTVCLEQGLADEAAQVFLRILGKEPGHATARVKLEEALRGKTQKRKGS
jgi:tetratricopeptide (TPR) repeat protein